MANSRKALVAGNWKMNGNQALLDSFVDHFKALELSHCDVTLCPPAVFLASALKSADVTGWNVGAQTVSEHDNGAHTGDISSGMLAEMGCKYVIVGHSERRSDHAETNDLVAAKAKKVLAAGMTPIICVGESLETREAEQQEEFVEAQLTAVFQQLTLAELNNVVVAYEPIWAIGTGVTASPEQAQSMHAFIRSLLATKGQQIADSTRLLYGGSVKSNNAEALFSQNDIDGGLIGGASLNPQEFEAICQAVNA